MKIITKHENYVSKNTYKITAMTHESLIQYKKSTALNALRKLYHPKTKHNFTYYQGEGSLMEQISYEAQGIIEQLERELLELKRKNRNIMNTECCERIKKAKRL